MPWSDFKKWYMDIIKSVIIFAFVAVVSYLIIDTLNNNREKMFHKWKVSENLYNDIIREFESTYRRYEKNLEACLIHKIFQQKNDFSESKLNQYDSNMNNLLEELESLKYWSNRRGISINIEVQKMKEYLRLIDLYPQQNIIFLKEEYQQNRMNRYKEYWETKERDEILKPYIDSLNITNENILNKLLYVDD